MSADQMETTPLSLQQRFLAMFAPKDHGQVEPEDGPFGPKYHGVRGWRWSGRLDLDRLREAVESTVAAHQALRSELHLSEDGHQSFVEPKAAAVAVVDLSAYSPTDIRVEEFLNSLELQHLPVSEVPHFRVYVAELGQDDYVVALLTHHVAMDGVSMGLIFDSLLDAYLGATGPMGSLGDQPTRVAGYGDFATWQSENMDVLAPVDSQRFWRSHMAGQKMVGMPGDRPAGEKREGTAVFRFKIPASTMAEARGLAKAQRATMHMILLAAFNLMVAERTTARSVLIPTITHGRPTVAQAEGKGFEATVGPFFNFVPLLTNLDGIDRLQEVIPRVRTAVSQAQEAEIPFPLVAAESPHIMETFQDPLVGVCAFQSFPYDDEETRTWDDFSVTEVRSRLLSQGRGSDIPNGALFTVEVQSTGDSYGTVRYDPGQFNSGTISSWVGRFTQILDAMSGLGTARLEDTLVEWGARVTAESGV